MIELNLTYRDWWNEIRQADVPAADQTLVMGAVNALYHSVCPPHAEEKDVLRLNMFIRVSVEGIPALFTLQPGDYARLRLTLVPTREQACALLDGCKAATPTLPA